MNGDQFLKVAKKAALEAGEIISEYFGQEHEYRYKNEDKSDFATQADLESEHKIVEIITKSFPEHSIIAEESGQTDKKSEYTWIIDPLDGTLAFASGLPLSAISIALLKENQPILGIVYQVMTEALYWAQKGKGAYLNNKRMKVSKVDKLESASIGMDVGHKKSRAGKFDSYILPLKKVRYMYGLGSDAAMLALVGKGSLDAFPTSAWVWDFAGGAVIVEEAGGKVTDLQGLPVDWTKKRIEMVATNGLLHDQVLEALSK